MFRIRLKNLHSLAYSLLFVMAMAPLQAFAQHSDIWLILDNGQVAASPVDLDTSNNVLVDQSTGYFLFRGDFDDLGQGAEGTDDPGVQTQANTFTPNSILYFNAVGSLMYWDGSAWVNSVPDQERLQLVDALGNDTFVDINGVTNAAGAIDQVSSGGLIHSHNLKFYIDNTLGSGSPAPGQYMIDVQFYVTDTVGGTVIHTHSEPVRIAFNYQDSANADAAIMALTSPVAENVPVPTVFLWALAALMIMVVKRLNTSRQS